MKNRVIFLLGHGRSGTTLLNRVLSAHPRICFINDEFNDLPFFYNLDSSYGKYGSEKYKKMAKDFFDHPWLEMSSRDIKADNFKEFISKIFDSFCVDNESDFVGVKIANNISENVDMIKKVFPEAYCIHIIRDPRDVFLSLKKTVFGLRSPFYAGKSWKDAIDDISSLKNEINNYYEIRYEGLISEPEKELRKLCKFLGIKFSKEMLSFSKDVDRVLPHQKLLIEGFVGSNYNKWKNELTRKELELVYAGTGKKINELGYLDSPHENTISFSERLNEFIYSKISLYWKLLRYGGILTFSNRPHLFKTRLKRF